MSDKIKLLYDAIRYYYNPYQFVYEKVFNVSNIKYAMTITMYMYRKKNNKLMVKIN